MVTHINFAVEDDVAERAKDIKNNNDWSWPVYFEKATENFEAEVGTGVGSPSEEELAQAYRENAEQESDANGGSNGE